MRLREDGRDVPGPARAPASLFLFAFVGGVEPTNNAAERALRHAVIWRKQSGGPRSASGAAYLGAIWSVVETCRQRGRDVWDYLAECIAAARRGQAVPELIPARAA